MKSYQVLLKHGARLDLCDELGFTPYIIAASSGKIEVLEFLRRYAEESKVSLGIESKSKSGMTPLQLCNVQECRRVLRVEIQNGIVLR